MRAHTHTHILVPWFIIFEGVSLSLKSVYNKTYAISLSAGRERKQRHREKTFNWQPGDYYTIILATTTTAGHKGGGGKIDVATVDLFFPEFGRNPPPISMSGPVRKPRKIKEKIFIVKIKKGGCSSLCRLVYLPPLFISPLLKQNTKKTIYPF